MTKEEEAILWRVLESLPETYREPMVLFYRQAESIRAVAEALGVTEEVVRQRLSRGRTMLNERVAKVVESGLRRSGPGKGFGVAVVAALPVASAKAAAIGAAVTSAKASGTAKGAGLAGMLGSAAASLIPITGGAIGLWGLVRNAASAREREFLTKATLGLVVWVAIFAGVILFLPPDRCWSSGPTS
jgi:hypothetical protein